MCCFVLLSWNKTGTTALPGVGDNCCTLRADTFESLSCLLAVELWEVVVVGKGRGANLILTCTACGGREKARVPLSPTSSHPANAAHGDISLGVLEKYKPDPHLPITVSVEICVAVLSPSHFLNFKPATQVSPTSSTQNSRT